MVLASIINIWCVQPDYVFGGRYASSNHLLNTSLDNVV